MITNKECPQVRLGFLGLIDRFIGPGATRSEIILQLLTPILAAILALWYANNIAKLNWSLFQQIVCFFIAADTVGGVVTNATSTAKRWYHRAGQSLKSHMFFILLHFIQLFLISWCFLALDWHWIVVSGFYLIVAALILLNTKLYLQRPVAMILYTIALILSMYILRSPPGIEWFLPLFYTKLIVSHLPQEEPYRPDSEC